MPPAASAAAAASATASWSPPAAQPGRATGEQGAISAAIPHSPTAGCQGHRPASLHSMSSSLPPCATTRCCVKQMRAPAGTQCAVSITVRLASRAPVCCNHDRQAAQCGALPHHKHKRLAGEGAERRHTAHLNLGVAAHHHVLCQNCSRHRAPLVHSHVRMQARALHRGAAANVAIAAHDAVVQACTSIHGAAASNEGAFGDTAA